MAEAAGDAARPPAPAPLEPDADLYGFPLSGTAVAAQAVRLQCEGAALQAERCAGGWVGGRRLPAARSGPAKRAAT
jgi:hypothetical protein